jgi:hypothetical protein
VAACENISYFQTAVVCVDETAIISFLIEQSRPKSVLEQQPTCLARKLEISHVVLRTVILFAVILHICTWLWRCFSVELCHLN